MFLKVDATQCCRRLTTTFTTLSYTLQNRFPFSDLFGTYCTDLIADDLFFCVVVRCTLCTGSHGVDSIVGSDVEGDAGQPQVSVVQGQRRH